MVEVRRCRGRQTEKNRETRQLLTLQSQAGQIVLVCFIPLGVPRLEGVEVGLGLLILAHIRLQLYFRL